MYLPVYSLYLYETLSAKQSTCVQAFADRSEKKATAGKQPSESTMFNFYMTDVAMRLCDNLISVCCLGYTKYQRYHDRPG